MDRYTIYCSKEQTERAYRLGAPIDRLDSESELEVRMSNAPDGMFNYGSFEHYRNEEDYPNSVIFETDDWGLAVFYKPTAEQMCGWLRDAYNIRIEMVIPCYTVGNFGDIIESGSMCDMIKSYNEVYKLNILAEIDAALDYLENKKEL